MCCTCNGPSDGYEQELIYALQDAGFDVALCSGFKVNNYSKALGFNAKNDTIDSYVIKPFAQDMFDKGKLSICPVKSLAFRNLECWLNRIMQTIKILTSEKQRLGKCQDKGVIKLVLKPIKFHEMK